MLSLCLWTINVQSQFSNTYNKTLLEAQKKLEIYDAQSAKQLCYKVQNTIKPNTSDYFLWHQILAKSEALAANYTTALEIWEKAHKDKNTPLYYYYKILWLKERGNYKQAYEEVYLWQQIEKRRNTADYITANLLLVELNLLLSNYTPIKPILQEIEKLTQDLYGTQHPVYYQVLAQLALYHKEMQEYKLSEQYFMQILPYYREENNIEYAYLTAQLSGMYAKIGSYDRAKEILQKAEERLQTTKYMPLSVFYTVLSQKVDIYQEVGKYDEVQKTLTYLEQKILQQSHNQHPLYALTLYRKAKYLFHTAQYIEAEEYAQQALNILTSQWDEYHIHVHELKALAANIALALGQSNTAKRILQSLISIQAEQLGYYHPLYLENIQFLARIYMQERNFSLAANLMEKAYHYAQQNAHLTASTRLRIYMDYQYLKSLSNPKEYSYTAWNSIEQELSFQQQHSQLALCYIQQAEIFLIAQKYDSAQHKVQQALLILQSSVTCNPTLLVQSYHILAKSYFYTKPDSALYCYQAALKHLFTLTQELFPYMNEHEQLYWYQKMYALLEEYQQFSVQHIDLQQQNHQYMVIFELYCKSILLRTHQKFRISVSNVQSQELKTYFQEWQHNKKLLIQGLFNFYQHLNVDSIQKQAAQIERYLRTHLNFETQRLFKLYTWQEVLNAIPDSSALWLTIRIPVKKDSLYYLHYLIEKKNLYPKYILQKNGNYIEQEVILKYKKYIKGVFDVQEQVYEHFWRPIQDALFNTTKIYYIPDGVFYQVNPNTLYDIEKEEYLLLSYDFYCINHIEDISTVIQTDDITSRTAVLFGYPDYAMEKMNTDSTRGYLLPLPGTKAEVENIKKLLQRQNWKVQVYLSQQATEDNLKKIHNPAILHIATHGFYIDNSKNKFLQKRIGISDSALYSIPLLRSGLMLAGAEKTLESSYHSSIDDGILLGYEAQHLNLENTELVVLSACETGLGSVMAGEGIFGLQRAFEMAGAKTVMTSLWNVNDNATQLLMTYFYSFWLNYRNKQTALKMAQIAVMKEYSYPYYWGAFVLVY
ncbi:MAG: CHAT domain-containing protein [Bacteroidia bacterium]|nr:CHAT domain-containing protein [Bacteroidia bacterium]